MAATLAHRGPDDEGFYSTSRVGLANRRLKIIDLSEQASQPMQDESSRFAITFNGEIYNFKQLREELKSKYAFFSHSDTEVILRLFQEKREETWPLLNGMFAVAIYDAKTEELYLARDHAGVKPLYFYQDHEKVLFASELRALLSSTLIEKDLDRQALAGYLRFGYFAGTATPYRGIQKLRPGTWAKVHSNGVEVRPYWNVRDFQRPSETSGLDPQKHLEDLLLDSVRNQMISDVPLGAFLSGGVDSSLIVALMSRVSKEPVKTFTVGFSGMGYYDERPYAARVARHFKTDHQDAVVEDRLEDLLARIVEVFDEPFADASAIPTYTLARMARKHVTVALSGTGGDEIFGGYRKYMAANWLGAYQSLPDSVRTSLRKAAGILPGSRKSLWLERALLFQRFTELGSHGAPQLQLNLLFDDQEIRELLDIEPSPLPPSNETNPIAEEMMLFDYENYLPENLLVKEDRCTMTFGLEARVPFLDRKVVEFMTSLPISFKVTAATTKRLFKRVAKEYLPGWILKRPKHGFGSPVAEWLRQDLHYLATDTLFSSESLLKHSLVKEKFEKHQKGDADHSRQLWPLIMLELWNQKV